MGLDQYGEGTRYRNHFVTGDGSTDWPVCQSLCQMGLMQQHGSHEIYGGDHCFTVTPAGSDAVIIHSPPRPKISRSRRRYLEWLDADCGLKFGEWLKRRKVCR